MWIRSQNDDVLVNLDRISVLKHNNAYGSADDHGPTHAIAAYIDNSEESAIELGRYHSLKRVGEILEEIEDEIEKEKYTIVYYMPSD